MADSDELKLHRLRWAGPLTISASVAAVLAVRTIAVVIVKPDPRFFPLSRGLPVFDTVVFATAAVLVFVKFCRYNAEPIADYRRVARRILLVSFLPDLLLGFWHAFGGGWPEAISLMAMHVVVWAICVTMLPLSVVPSRG